MALALSANALVTLADLPDLLGGKTISAMDETNFSYAVGYLSDVARLIMGVNYGAAVAPRPVKHIIVGAALRYLSNPDGVIQSRAGDESLSWSESSVQGLGFSREEKSWLEQYRPGTVQSIGVYAYNNSSNTIEYDDNYVPVSYGGKDFRW